MSVGVLHTFPTAVPQFLGIGDPERPVDWNRDQLLASPSPSSSVVVTKPGSIRLSGWKAHRVEYLTPQGYVKIHPPHTRSTRRASKMSVRAVGYICRHASDQRLSVRTRPSFFRGSTTPDSLRTYLTYRRYSLLPTPPSEMTGSVASEEIELDTASKNQQRLESICSPGIDRGLACT